MTKAKATGIRYHGQYSDIVEYEYRGKKYEVEYGTMYYCITAPYIQHRDAQEKIDREIEKEEAEAKYRTEHPDWQKEIDARRKETDDFLDAFFESLQ